MFIETEKPESDNSIMSIEEQSIPPARVNVSTRSAPPINVHVESGKTYRGIYGKTSDEDNSSYNSTMPSRFQHL
jgi:hypothetical protein